MVLPFHTHTNTNLCEAILQRAGWFGGDVTREADLFALFEGPCGDSVQVAIPYTTAQTGQRQESREHRVSKNNHKQIWTHKPLKPLSL